jgi:hypothetical protein
MTLGKLPNLLGSSVKKKKKSKLHLPCRQKEMNGYKVFMLDKLLSVNTFAIIYSLSSILRSFAILPLISLIEDPGTRLHGLENILVP